MSLLPKELNYLDEVASVLARIPQDQINEDVDMDAIEAALRQRVKGMKLRDAISRLTEDRAILEQWLQQKGHKSSPAFLISIYMMRPGPLARQLLAPPLPPEPEIVMETPEGWTSKASPRSLEMKKGKLFCSIILYDRAGFEHVMWSVRHRKELQWGSNNPWANLGVWSELPAQFGLCHGEKHHYAQTGKTNWKSVEYGLEVPGGYVYVRVGHTSGKDFDETEVEQKLHTLKVIPPKPLVTAPSISSC